MAGRSQVPATHREDPWLGAELALAILHREAEALILYDPIFPADPFAP